MKKVILILCMLVSLVSAEQQFDSSIRERLAKAIEIYGYVCKDAHSAIRPPWSDAITVYCDDYATVYKVFKVGGNWTIEPK